MAGHLRSCLVLLTVLGASTSNALAADSRNVLVLYSDPTIGPALADFTDGLRNGLGPAASQLEPLHLDITRFPGEEHDQPLADWLTTRYHDNPVSVVVTVGTPASLFASRFAAHIWPGARIVHASIDGAQLKAVMARGEPFVARRLQYRRTVEGVLTFLPAVRRVFLIGGATAQDRRWLAEAEADLAALGARVHIERIAGLAWEETLERVRHLPDDAVAIAVSFFADRAGRTFIVGDAIAEIARTANRPVFGVYRSFVGNGPVGGYVSDSVDMGRLTAGIVLGLLNTETAFPRQDGADSQWLFDAAQLRRWNIAERDLPAGSTVRNRQPSLWGQYRWYVVGAAGVIMLQALLIGGLLAQRARRQRAEQAARANETALRQSSERIGQLAGQLTTAQETTRTRIARDLHDDAAQRLALLSLELTMLNERVEQMPASVHQQLAEMSARAAAIGSDLHRLSHELHPALLEQRGLEAAIRSFCRELSDARHVNIEVDVRLMPQPLPPDVALCLYRVTQEALHNVVRHSGASSAVVRIESAGADVLLSVVDRGTGFDPRAVRAGTSLGLQSIEERVHLLNGQLSVRSKKGEGTRIEARVPLLPHVTSSALPGVPARLDSVPRPTVRPIRPPASTRAS
jgi:signal transduction histidine kinase